MGYFMMIEKQEVHTVNHSSEKYRYGFYRIFRLQIVFFFTLFNRDLSVNSYKNG